MQFYGERSTVQHLMQMVVSSRKGGATRQGIQVCAPWEGYASVIVVIIGCGDYRMRFPRKGSGRLEYRLQSFPFPDMKLQLSHQKLELRHTPTA